MSTSASSKEKQSSTSYSRLPSELREELLEDAHDPRRREALRAPEVPRMSREEAIAKMVELIEALEPQIRANQKRLRELRPLGKFVL